MLLGRQRARSRGTPPTKPSNAMSVGAVCGWGGLRAPTRAEGVYVTIIKTSIKNTISIITALIEAAAPGVTDLDPQQWGEEMWGSAAPPQLSQELALSNPCPAKWHPQGQARNKAKSPAVAHKLNTVRRRMVA